MYIVKNACRSIFRSVGRNLLIAIIVFVIAVSACIGLSIRRASETAKEDLLEGMTVTASIELDTSGAKGPGSIVVESEVTLEDLQSYASAQSVQDFYYTLTLGMNGSEEFAPVEIEFKLPEGLQDMPEMPSDMEMPEMPEGMGGMNGFNPFGGGMFTASSEFSVVGYSSETAMTDFLSGTASLTSGTIDDMFDTASATYPCVITAELANTNEIAVGDTVTVVSPDNEEEIYVLTVVGIYENSGSTSFGGRGSGGAGNPSNQILMSTAALNALTEASAEAAAQTGVEALSAEVAGTYVFADVTAYEQFEAQARELGLPDEYKVFSSDVSEFEQQLVPLDTLGKFAEIFLIVVLVIGAAILIVLNLFNIRERKYEVGVLTAIGMKKYKVAVQFVLETLIVAVFAVTLGAAVGAVTSVPVTNVLLEQQVASQENTALQQEQAFGRGDMMRPGGNMDFMPGDFPGERPEKGGFEGFKEKTTEYITQITSATDMVVLVQLVGVGLLLTVLSSLVSVIFIMRYDPLKILANRD